MAKSKRSKRKKDYSIWLVIAFLSLITYSLVQNTVTGNVVKEEKIIIYFPAIDDFPNDEQGSVKFNFAFPEASFKVGEKRADVLMFLKSETIFGLNIGYYPKERKLKGGLPNLISPEVTVLDGKMHEVVYVFSRANNKQAIFLDGKLLVEGVFEGKHDGSLTGAVVYQREEWIESDININAAFG